MDNVFDNNNFREHKAEELGIADSASWKNMSYWAYSITPSPSSSQFATALEGNQVVIARRNKVYVFDKETKICRFVIPTLDNKEIDFEFWSDCEVMNGYLYWTDGKKAYRTSLEDGATEILYQINRHVPYQNFLHNFWKSTDSFGNTKLLCIWKKISSDQEHVKQILIDIEQNIELTGITENYGEEIIGAGDNKLLLAAHANFADGYYRNAKYVYDFCDDRCTSLYEYAFEGIKHKMTQNIDEGNFERRVYAVDLRAHAVVVSDFPELTRNAYKEGSLVVIKKDGLKRINNVYRQDISQNKIMKSHSNGMLYRDCRGHELTVDNNYCLVYRKPDGSVQNLIETSGSCVPETFRMVDNHTGVLKVTEDSVSIIDFAENKKYEIDFSD